MGRTLVRNALSAVMATTLMWSSAAFAASDNSRRCVSALSPAAQISEEWLDQMQTRPSVDAAKERLRDVAREDGIRAAVYNRALLRQHNSKYTCELAHSLPSDQHDSGRCWAFASLAMIQDALRTRFSFASDFKLSANYLYFWHILEQANTHLEEIIKENRKDFRVEYDLDEYLKAEIADAASFDEFRNLVERYGIVPELVMPETDSSRNPEDLLWEIRNIVGRYGKQLIIIRKQYQRRTPAVTKELRRLKYEALEGVYEALTIHLGTPPKTFAYRENIDQNSGAPNITSLRADIRTFTPREFARDILKFNAKDYAIVEANPNKTPGSVHKTVINLTVERMIELTKQSLASGHPVLVMSAIDRPADKEYGIFHPEIFDYGAVYRNQGPEILPRDERLKYFLWGENHAMLLVGYDQPDPAKPVVKFKVVNSWGDEVGDGGYFHMYREWFEENVEQIVVPTRLLNDTERAALEKR